MSRWWIWEDRRDEKTGPDWYETDEDPWTRKPHARLFGRRIEYHGEIDAEKFRRLLAAVEG